MRNRWKILLSVLLYIVILAGVLRFDLLKLLSLQVFLQLVVGIVILTIPYIRRKSGWREFILILGSKALEAGYIQAFLLLFARMSSEKGYDNLLSDIALCFRPVLYGFVIHMLFVEQRGNEGQEESVHVRTPNYEHFLELGLTKREAQIAVLICKGFSNREIAEEFVISEATVKKHISNIFEKLEIEKREELKNL
ncbi:MAG: helix-turn-helix transcriptional regulator [Lachnospiraceae bacterium]|nr:helix-turn-helix transcriptional regulator [Lachnospiraceae bacterium]